MKKTIAILCALLLMLSLTTTYAEQEHKTKFDTYFEWSPVIEIKDADWIYDTTDVTPEQITETNEDIAMFAAIAWNELFRYETTAQGKAAEDTMAAGIYRGIKDGPAVVCFTACDPKAVCANILIAANQKAWWFEWNLEDQMLRVGEHWGVEEYASEDEFLSDYVFNSLLSASIDGNSLLSTQPEDSIALAFGASSGICQFFDVVYERMNDGAPVPIK